MLGWSQKSQGLSGIESGEIVKSNEKGFFRSISNKRKTGENTALVLDGAGDLIKRDVGKAEALPDFFTSFFFVKTYLQESQILEMNWKVWSNADLPLSPWDLMACTHECGGSGQCHCKSSSIIFGRLWHAGQEESECQEVQEGPENHRPGKVVEQILLGTIYKDIKDKNMIWKSQHKLSKGKS